MRESTLSALTHCKVSTHIFKVAGFLSHTVLHAHNLQPGHIALASQTLMDRKCLGLYQFDDAITIFIARSAY